MNAQTTSTSTTGGEHRWPIAAAMLQFPAVLPDGSLVQDQSPEGWTEALTEVAEAGFDCLDPTDSWLRVADLSAERLAAFLECVAAAGLRIPAISTSRRSVVDPEHGAEYLAYGHRLLDAAAVIGAEVVSFGFMQALTPAQQQALWFWTAPGARDRDDPQSRATAVRAIRELAQHGAEVGVQITLEMYEDTYLGSADECVRFLADVDHPNAGLNPDLGNLVRLHRKVEPWLEMAEKTLPHANYWHVKNYFRAEVVEPEHVVTMPAPLELGVMNYRALLKLALAHGFSGPICVEHYGGDGLSVAARNRDYLHGLLPPAHHLNQAKRGRPRAKVESVRARTTQGRPLAPEPVAVGDGKGKATPKRRDSQAARKQPLVRTGSTALGKGASKEAKAAARAERMRGRELMMAGDERYLLGRDKGPVRRFVRDAVDSRWNVGEFLLPVMLVVVILSFSGLQTQQPGIFAVIFVLVYAMLVVAGIDAFLLNRRIRRRVAERFGADADISGIGMYAVFRAFQLRRSRIPRPGVKRGQQPR